MTNKMTVLTGVVDRAPKPSWARWIDIRAFKSNGTGAVSKSWQNMLRQGIDLTREGALSTLRAAVAPLYEAGRKAFEIVTLVSMADLAKATHNAYFEGSDKPAIADPTTWACDPTKITPANVDALKALLTEAGQAEADKFVSGQHIGKVFIMPAHILPGKAAEFLAFFGKTDAGAISILKTLVNAGDAKKKIVNNQAMSWDQIISRLEGTAAIYRGAEALGMRAYETGLQMEAILDSAIVLAALELGSIDEADIYTIYHALWATHNDWQQMGQVNYRDLDSAFGPGTAAKDRVILDAHRNQQMNALRPIIDMIKRVGSPTGLRANPLHDLFQTGIEPVAPATMKGTLMVAAERSRDFKAGLSSALDPTDKERKIANLSALAEERGIKSLTAEEATMLFMAFKDLGAFADAIRIYEECQSEEFKRSSVIREFYAVALNKTGQAEQSIAVGQALIDEGKANGETYGALGKAYLVKSNAAADPGEKQQLLEKSYKYYLQGYLIDFDYYPGVNAVYRLNELGRQAEAEKLAEMVHYSTLMAGGLQSSDYWCLVTMLEVNCIRRTYANREGRMETAVLLDKVLSAAKTDWEISSSLANLSALRDRRKAAGENVDSLNRVIAALDKRMDEIRAGSAVKPDSRTPIDLLDERSDLTREVMARSFYYRGLRANYVPGNYGLGGRLHDHVVNRADLQIVNRILSGLGLEGEASFPAFNRQIDGLIRRQFGADRLEALGDQAHHDFDFFMAGLKDISASETAGDSSTNITADFLFAQGDCRQQSYFKQLCFDVWKNSQIRNLLGQAYQALMKDNDHDRYNQLMEQVKRLERQQMFVFDVMVRAQIKLKGLYQPERDFAGNLLRADEMGDYERHTLTAVATFYDLGNIVGLRAADSFYQNKYAWRDHDLRPTLLADGTLELDGGTIMAVDNEGAPAPVPVKLRPDVYAGKRDQPSNDEYGQLRMRGWPVATPADISALLRTDRAPSDLRRNLDAFAAAVIEHGRNVGRVEVKG